MRLPPRWEATGPTGLAARDGSELGTEKMLESIRWEAKPQFVGYTPKIDGGELEEWEDVF